MPCMSPSPASPTLSSRLPRQVSLSPPSGGFRTHGELAMNKFEKKLGHLFSFGFLIGGLLAVLLAFRTAPVKAHVLPAPCDFTTGGGFVLTDAGNHANFGLVGGCKHGGFFGHVNFVDHNNGLHVSSDSITGYVNPCPGCDGVFAANNARDICGT